MNKIESMLSELEIVLMMDTESEQLIKIRGARKDGAISSLNIAKDEWYPELFKEIGLVYVGILGEYKEDLVDPSLYKTSIFINESVISGALIQYINNYIVEIHIITENGFYRNFSLGIENAKFELSNEFLEEKNHIHARFKSVMNLEKYYFFVLNPEKFIKDFISSNIEGDALKLFKKILEHEIISNVPQFSESEELKLFLSLN